MYKTLFRQFMQALKEEDTLEAATILSTVTKANHPQFYKQLCRAFTPTLHKKPRKKPNVDLGIEHICHARTFSNGTGEGCCSFKAKHYVDLPNKQGTVGLCTIHANLWNTCREVGKPQEQHNYYFWKPNAAKAETTIHTWKGKHTETLSLNLTKLTEGQRNTVPYTYGTVYVTFHTQGTNKIISIAFPKKGTKCERTFSIPTPKNNIATITFPIPTGLKYGLKYGPDHKPYKKVIYKGRCGENGYNEDKFRRPCLERAAQQTVAEDSEEDTPPLPNTTTTISSTDTTIDNASSQEEDTVETDDDTDEENDTDADEDDEEEEEEESDDESEDESEDESDDESDNGDSVDSLRFHGHQTDSEESDSEEDSDSSLESDD